MRSRVLVLLALIFSLAAGAGAQQQPSASQVQAAEELVQAMNVSNGLSDGIDMMLEAQLKAQIETNPQLAQFKDIIRQFMAKYLTWESAKPGMVQLYAEAFTEPELRELTTFYKTPLGQKTITKLPELFQKGIALGQKAAQEHLPELQEAIAKKMKESGGADKKP
jgi:hypothetical protein